MLTGAPAIARHGKTVYDNGSILRQGLRNFALSQAGSQVFGFLYPPTLADRFYPGNGP